MSDFIDDLNTSSVPPKDIRRHLRSHGIDSKWVETNSTNKNDGGCDAVSFDTYGRTTVIDTKQRREIYPDRAVVLELTAGSQPGWAVDFRKNTDIILVVWPDDFSKVYSASRIRQALKCNRRQWADKFGVRTNYTRNFGGYASTFIPVPAHVLDEACAEAA